MTGPGSDPKGAKGAKGTEKRRLDEALEEGLEETFPGSDPVSGDSAGALQRRPTGPPQALAQVPSRCSITDIT